MDWSAYTAWQLSGGPVGLPAKWADTSNVEEWSGTEEGPRGGPLTRKGGLYSAILFAGAPEFLVTSLIMGPVC